METGMKLVVNKIGWDKNISDIFTRLKRENAYIDMEVFGDLQHMRERKTEMLLVFNLSGFNHTTLTDNISYNLLPCKQIHILTKDNPPNEKYLEKQLSISMFFYCTDSKYYQYLLEKYPDIPYLKEVKGWKNAADEESAEANAKILSEIIEEVMQICHMA